MTGEKYLSISEAARMPGVSDAALRQWTDEGRTKAFITPGGYRRYSRAELRRFARAQPRSVDIMELAAPPGPVYQAGTLSGNPLAMSAEIETLKMLRPPGTREHLEASAASLEAGLRQAATAAGVESCLLRVGSLLTLFLTGETVTDYASAATGDTARFARFFRELRQEGAYRPPSHLEAVFVSLTHTGKDIHLTRERRHAPWPAWPDGSPGLLQLQAAELVVPEVHPGTA